MKCDKNQGVIKAVKLAGGQTQLAKLCGCAQSTVWEWIHRQCPVTRAVQLEQLTGVCRTEIRPDIFKEG